MSHHLDNPTIAYCGCEACEIELARRAEDSLVDPPVSRAEQSRARALELIRQHCARIPESPLERARRDS